MEIKEFIEKFAEIFDETDIADITSATNFKDLDDWSSLAALSIIAMADDEYNVTLKGEEIRKTETVADLFELIKSKQQ